MIQKLQGVKVTPRNTRFNNWPNSYAFGGWIYNASVNVNYSSEPTEIKLSIVLETSTFEQSAAVFDINPDDLYCGAGNGGEERLYDIDLDGVKFTDFVLYEYDFSIEVNDKILNVTFKDYSIVLDKIYVGLFKSQGYNEKFIKTAPCKIEIPIRCQDCEYTGSAITGIGETYRDINFASYAKINGEFKDNFSNFYYQQGKNVYDAWQKLISEASEAGQANNPFINPSGPNGRFDLNGGYLIIGTESATSERCSSAPNITYSFIELLASLRKNGMSFDGDFPSNAVTSDFVYRNSYIGTLREVLQNWCSDLGYDFYCEGKKFIGIDLKKTIDISEIYKISDPTSELGKNFKIGGESAILSFKSASSLRNTFKQSVIVQNSYPITQVDRQKSVKRYIGITPLHPISLNEISRQGVIDSNIYGIPFQRAKYEVPYFDDNYGISAYQERFTRLDGRSFKDIDTAIALSNYNDTLRDLFVAQRALRNYLNLVSVDTRGNALNALCGPIGVYSSYDGYIQVNRPPQDNTSAIADWFNTDSVASLIAIQRQKEWEPQFCFPALWNPYCVANFNALGITPILEIFNLDLKADIIEEFFQNAEKNGIANLNPDARYFRVFLGYYSEKLKNDIVNWEKAAAESMYKYGIVTKGPISEEPFVFPDVLSDISPTAGFYGKKGISYTRIKNNFTPSANRYKSTKEAPFANALLYSGFIKSSTTGVYPENNPNFPALVPPGFSEYPGRLPTGLWVSSLDNPWGTRQESFDRQLSFNFNDECFSQYSIDQTVEQVLTDSDRNAQDWKLEYFLPIISPDLSRISEIIQTDFYYINDYIDAVVTTYTDLNLIEKKDCKKIHVIIIPDTRIHPNLKIDFTENPINKINGEYLSIYKQKIYEAEQNKKLTQTPSICSLSLVEEMCQNILSGGTGYNFRQNKPRFTRYNGKLVEQNKEVGCVILEDKNNPLLDGFDKDLIHKANSRSLSITIHKNPGTLGEMGPATDINGDYYLADLKEEILVASSNSATLEIVYPIQSYAGGIANYSGILTSDISTEYRLPALNQIYGEPISIKNNNASSIKIINKQTDDTLNPELNPTTNEALSYVTVLDSGGDNNVVKTPAEYYELIKNLNEYNLDTPMKSVDIVLAGSPNLFGNFKNYISPIKGLNQFSLSVTDNGVKTSLTFADRPKVLPQQEVILNKIGPRIKGNYN